MRGRESEEAAAKDGMAGRAAGGGPSLEACDLGTRASQSPLLLSLLATKPSVAVFSSHFAEETGALGLCYDLELGIARVCVAAKPQLSSHHDPPREP